MVQEPDPREKFLLRVAMFVFGIYMLIQTYCLIVQTLHRK
jgi:hypothetical protein